MPASSDVDLDFEGCYTLGGQIEDLEKNYEIRASFAMADCYVHKDRWLKS